jgi:hypothetical protein
MSTTTNISPAELYSLLVEKKEITGSVSFRRITTSQIGDNVTVTDENFSYVPDGASTPLITNESTSPAKTTKTPSKAKRKRVAKKSGTARASSKLWKIKTPTGETEEVTNLSAYCKERKISAQGFYNNGKSSGYEILEKHTTA